MLEDALADGFIVPVTCGPLSSVETSEASWYEQPQSATSDRMAAIVSLQLAAPATATGIGAAPPFQYHYINAGGTTPDRPPQAGTPNDVRHGAYKTPDWVNGR